jgi:myo-inositol-1(or 4)-monophosphatase
MDPLLLAARKAATEAGKLLIANFGKVEKTLIRSKSNTDFISYVDEQAEQTIIDIIKTSYPDHSFLAEERGEKLTGSLYRWIIDPLDGTTNYLHSIPVFAISIALEFQNEIILGVVYDPVHNDLFSAFKGQGAFHNDQQIHVSDCNHLNQAFIATGFPFKSKHYLTKYLRAFKNIFNKSIGARRMGAAAIDLAYVACGRFDGFWEVGLQPWDIAAGSILIKEAGGSVTDFWNNPNFKSSSYIMASNKKIHKEFGDCIRAEFPNYKNINEEIN